MAAPEQFDLVIIDQMMPQRSGVEAVFSKRVLPGKRVLLGKPVDSEHLLAEVARLLRSETST